MLMKNMIYIVAVLSFWSLASTEELCTLCDCGKKVYYEQTMYMVNCTAKNITLANINLLETLPESTEVLILQENNISSLPVNLFGTEKNFTNLKIVDMSSNKIEQIKGKTFHHVPNVELLILNHNAISFDNNSHPRLFSNLKNLEELHLTDAFHDYESPNLASQLHDVFINSNLIKLKKLHLEQNEIKNFSDPKVFCDLKNLLDLHLGDNLLSSLPFQIDCLPRLRFLDFEGNRLHSFSDDELKRLDVLPEKNQSLTIDIRHNPFVCDCNSSMFFWLQRTKVVIVNSSSIRCHRLDHDEKVFLQDFNESECMKTKHGSDANDYEIQKVANLIIIIILCGFMALLLYLSVRYFLKYWKHASISSGKVHYVVIQNFDESRDARV